MAYSNTPKEIALDEAGELTTTTLQLHLILSKHYMDMALNIYSNTSPLSMSVSSIDVISSDCYCLYHQNNYLSESQKWLIYECSLMLASY